MKRIGAGTSGRYPDMQLAATCAMTASRLLSESRTQPPRGGEVCSLSQGSGPIGTQSFVVDDAILEQVGQRVHELGSNPTFKDDLTERLTLPASDIPFHTSCSFLFLPLMT